MSKKPKPKSEGCRWKVLWTFLLGFLLFGASNASAYSVTFVFNAPSDILPKVSILTGDAEPLNYTMDGNQVIITFTKASGYYVGLPTSSYTVTPSDVSSTDYRIDPIGDAFSNGIYYKYIDLKTGADGGTFTFQTSNYVPPTTDPDPEPGDESYVNLNFGGVNDAYKYVYLMNNDE